MKTTLIATAFILRLVSITEAHKGTVTHTLPEIQIRSEVSTSDAPRDMEAATDSVFTAVMSKLNESVVKKSTTAREKSRPQSNGAYAADVRIIGLMQ